MKRASSSSGVSLIVTLMMMAILVLMVVGLAGVMRNEQTAGRNLTYQVVAEQMAELGARQGMATVLRTSTNLIGLPSATGPGWMASNGVLLPLFSTNASGQFKNVEEIGTNSLVLGLPDATRGQLTVSWTNVVGPDGTVIGRHAWWVDDEGSKANLNAVGANNPLYLPFLTNFPVSANYLFVDPATGQTNAASTARSQALATRTNSLPTVESLKDTNILRNLGANSIGSTVYRRTKGHVTAWSSNVDLTPWGSQKFNLADPTLTSAQIKQALTTNAWSSLVGSGESLARKFGGGSPGSGNAGNHGDLVLDQIAANIKAAQGSPVIPAYQPALPNADARRHRGGLPLSVDSQIPGPWLEEVRTRLDFSISGNTIQSRIGILVVVVNPYAQSFSNYSLRVQPRKFRFNVEPTGANVTASGSSAPLNGFTGPVYNGNVWAGPEWTAPVFQPWPITSPFLSNGISYAARSRSEHIFSTTINLTCDRPPTRVPRAYVILDQVCLYASSPPNNTSLRDWLSADDLAQAANFTSAETGQMFFDGQMGNPAPVNAGANLPPLSRASFTPANSHGVRKIDPQVRFSLAHWNTNGTSVGSLRPGGWPATAQAWSRTLSMAQTFTNRLLAYLPPDPAPGVTDVLNHPHFVAGYRPTNGFKSAAQLGAIHTGIPWRTLRLQPTPANEMSQGFGPPDWFLLDVFTATNPAVSLPMINANGVPMAFRGGVVGVATNLNGSVPARTWALLSAMAPAAVPLPSGNSNAMASNGVPLSLTNASNAYGSLSVVGSNITAALTNLANAQAWSTNSGWGAVRLLRPAFSTNGLLLKGEILEIRGVAEDTNTTPLVREDAIEGRLRSFLDLISTRSDTFTVWSAGQGLAVSTNRGIRTNVMGEVRKQTVFQRLPQFNANGTVTGYRLRVLYTRNHVVE